VDATVLDTVDPQVRVTFEAGDLDASVSTVTVYRVVGGVETTVRSSLRAAAAGGWTGVDWEAPIGPVSYRAEMFDTSGNDLGSSASVSVTVPYTDADVAWLSDPLDATSAVRVFMNSGVESSQSRPVSGAKYPLGDRVVVLAGQRALLSGLAANFETVTAEDRDTVQALISRTGGLVLIRTSPLVPLPRLLYCWCPDPQPVMSPMDSFEQTLWQNQADEISEPKGAPAVFAVPLSVYEAAFPTLGDFEAAYSTFLEAYKNPPSSAVVPPPPPPPPPSDLIIDGGLL